ncbi:hypothetical protein FB45DRAFT_27170 [Roridomyces roridus]|uniref:Uncharacterized protein n=1 Tax=Roridomyces roridus TaxID=1738132 RepID=A0AAD7CMR0_9AGAR|nr:hypothetical protein FB45DRAFT_27170 [Roridomyces roridus]
MDSLLKLLPRLQLRRRESRRSRPKRELSTKQRQQPIILEGVLDISMEARDALAQEEQSHHESTSAFEMDLPPVSPTASGDSWSPRKTPKACCSDTAGSSSSRSSSPRIPHPDLGPPLSATSLLRERQRRNVNKLIIPPMPTTPPPIPPPRPRTSSPPPSHLLHPYTASDMQRCITFPLVKDYAGPSLPPPLPLTLPPLPRSQWNADSESLPLVRQPEAIVAPRSGQSPSPSPAADEEDGDEGERGGGRYGGGLLQQQSQSGTESEGRVDLLRVSPPPPLQAAESTTPPGTPWALQLTFPLPPRATFTKRASSSRYSGIAQLLPLLGDLEEVGAGVEPLFIVKPRQRGSLATVPSTAYTYASANASLSDHGIVDGGGSSSEEPDPPSPVSPVIDELFSSLDDVYAEFKSTEGSDEFMSISLGSGSDVDSSGDERGGDREGSDEFMSVSVSPDPAWGKRVSDESESAIKRYSALGESDSPVSGSLSDEGAVAWRDTYSRFRPNCTPRSNAPQPGERQRARLERERFLVGHALRQTLSSYTKSRARSLPDISST